MQPNDRRLRCSRALQRHGWRRWPGRRKRAATARLVWPMDRRKVLVNAIVALLATGGSTNHTMHWVAIARAAGFELTWRDIDALSRVTPLLTRLINGEADVNDFDRVGGTAFLFRELLAPG